MSEISLLNQLTQWINNNSVYVISAQTSIAVDDGSIYLVCTVVYTDDEIKL